MNQGGLKNVVTEPTRLENKRERRRGAAGRAAALRRAPSDSDCSGETASLSADSGDRAPRPPPQPTRAGKNRGRRRGSEWEVLEGLKDGQRFEKRPDVFNGYLHKKRKWPLKGWHKRFFVVDGGILVYARSPTDVARGRLHGSVDVGLSVISAKARRRRIDIDADEFIYHLRAKTPEVFRTWLNVLKAHRLYRQHLLTFGARESVPKIHAPLDDLPATDNSSRTSQDTISTTISTSDDFPFNGYDHMNQDLRNNSFCFCHTTFHSNDKRKLSQTPFKQSNVTKVFNNYRSLCSMNCVARVNNEDIKRLSSNASPGTTDAEKQVHSTDLDINSIRTIDTVVEDEMLDTREPSAVRYTPVSSEFKRPLLERVEPTTTFFFFSRNKPIASSHSPMKKSKKSTNLVKYRNEFDEPTLKRPLSNCMLLGKYTLKVSRHSDTEKNTDCAVACDPVPQENNEVQVTILESNKSLQDTMTSGYDNITTKLLTSIFPKINNVPPVAAQYCIKQVIKDLYDFKSQDVHPVKALFRSLLEYWLINTNAEPVKTAMRQTQCTDKQSNKHFTKDKNLSSLYISHVTKQTQFHGVSDMLMKYKKNRVPNTSTRVLENDPALTQTQTDSFQKERRIQQLERLLKNTVYICETIKNDPNKQKDIETTNTLKDKFEESESDNPTEAKKYNSVCSTEKLRETINHLISETSIPPDVAKQFLDAYLDILHKDDKSLTTTSSMSSESSIVSQISKADLPYEATIRASKSVSDVKPQKLKKVKSSETAKPIDPGQQYLKDIIDKITTIFSKAKKQDEKTKNDKKVEDMESGDLNDMKKQKDGSEKPVNDYHKKDIIRENFDENSVVIDLTKFDLEHISMFRDPVIRGIMSITIKLKEKPVTVTNPERAHLNLQFADSKPKKEPRADDWIKHIHPLNKSKERFPNKVKAAKNIQSNNPFIDCQKQFALRHYLSTSDATSKAYRMIHESDQSSAISFKSSQSFDSILGPSFENPSTQSCYMMSFKKELLPPNLQSRMKTKFKECGNVLTPKMVSPQRSPTKREKIKENTTAKYTGSNLFNKPTSRAIDEKFILLLLENLSLLSKNVPSLHKEISNLFTKLRKKHEKILKSCINIQGLSLLGKIYNEESCGTSKKNVNTQWDVPHPVNNKNIGREKAVNTSNIARGNDLKDANISAVDLTLQMNSEVQTLTKSEELKMNHPQNESITDTSLLSNMAQTGSVNSLVVTEFDVPTIDNSTSNPNWFRRLRKEQCSISNLIKCMIDTKAQISNLQVTREQYVKRKYEKLRRDLIAEMAILSPGYKVSTQSQTDRKFLRFTKESMLKNDFNVYQLYFSKKYFAKTSSLTESNVEIDPSDEMKTLYRCTSDPSCCSGLIVCG